MRRSIYALAAVFLLALAGCNLMTGPESGQSAAQDGKAAVSLAIAGTDARTVAPAHAELADVKTWKLWGTKTEEPPELLLESADPENEPLYLETGDWDFTLEGHKDGSDNTLILEGTKSQAISLEVRNTLTFTVAPVSEGTGTVRITINLPDGHGITQVKVFKGGVESGSVTPSGNSVVYQATHDAGNYYFSFRLFKGGELYGVVSELVKVRRNLTSEGTYTLEKEDLNLRYAITFHLDNGAFADEPPNSYRSTDADLVLPEPTRKGYEFKGWHADTAQGDKATNILQDSAGDKDFYTEWTPFTYTIEYVLDNKGTNHAENPPTYTVEDLPLTLKKPTPNSGYTFLYWYVSGYPNTPVYTIPTGSTEAKTFYAKWHQKGEHLASMQDIGAYLANAGDGTADDPIDLPVTINLADSGWTDLLTA
jgi:uncharacterized repeat protein (TIGR02543 family)